MTTIRRPGFLLLTALLVTPAAATERGAFVVTLGRDTTDIESFVRRPHQLLVEQVSRWPRVTRRHLAFEFDVDGGVRHFTVRETAAGTDSGAASLRTFEGTGTDDSVFVEIRSRAEARTIRVALPAGSPIIHAQAPWASYEAALARFARSGQDSSRAPFYRIGARGAGWIRMHRLGADSVSVLNHHDDSFRAAVDRSGRMAGLRPISGTGQFTVRRVPSIDIDGVTERWLVVERASGAMGALSARETVTANVGGASLWADYGRPSKRGREVFGALVPWNEVWRTGANAATQFRTDRALEFGAATLPAGTYTLWTVPSPGGWKLLINSETGQWGTAHRREKDLLSLDMKVATLPSVVERFTIGIEPTAEGGELRLDWDTTRASVGFRVATAN